MPGLGDRSPRMISKQALAGVIEPRVEEIFSLVQQVIRDSGFEEVLSSGVVLTGGSAVMPGMVELGEDGKLYNVGGISAFTAKRRGELVEELEPLVVRDEARATAALSWRQMAPTSACSAARGPPCAPSRCC